MAEHKGRARHRCDQEVGLGAVSAALGCSRATAYLMARAGEIPVTLRAGRYLMAKRDLASLVAERGDGSVQSPPENGAASPGPRGSPG
jgi:hypothetical protein